MAKDKFRIPLPLYCTNVDVYLTREAFLKGTGEKECAEAEDIDGCVSKMGMHAAVGLFSHDPDTICHEMFHATAHILGTRGMALSPSSEEAYAYMIGFLVGETHSQLNKRMEKDKCND